MDCTQFLRGRGFSGIFLERIGGRRGRRALCGALALAGGLAPVLAMGAVGTIPGRFAVTPTGQASYTIPIAAPGGVAGLAPKLALTVGTGLGAGPAGWNTAIGGLSVIRRCPSTHAYDGSVAPVSLTPGDRFCLDGQELTALDGTYGDDGTTYTTTPSAHIEAIAYPNNNAPGQQYFKVLHPDGTVWVYGWLDNSEVTATRGGNTVGRAWWLNRIYDPYGNTISFYYTQSDGVAYLQSVDWGNGRALTFDYETVLADAVSYRYVVGNLIQRTQRLKGVYYHDNGANQVEYYLSYLPDGEGSNRNRLASVQECASGDCLGTTTFQWQQGSVGYGAAQGTGQAGPTDANTFVADLDGDGHEDLLYDRGSYLRVRFGLGGGGFGGEVSTEVSTAHAWDAQPIHYSAGPAEDVLVENDNGHWAILSHTGSETGGSFYPHDTGIGVSNAPMVAVADLDGDGYDDLVSYHKDPGMYTGSTLVAYMNTGANGNPGFGSAQTAYTLDPSQGCTDECTASYLGFRAVGAERASGPGRGLHLTRVNGGLIARYAFSVTTCLVDSCQPGQAHTRTTWSDQAYVWDGNGLTPYGDPFDGDSSLGGGSDTPSKIIPLDVNGDGLTDLVIADADAQTLTLLRNTGWSFASLPYGYSTSGLTLSAAVAADYAGNGRDSLLIPGSNGDWKLISSTGNDLDTPTPAGIGDASDFGAQPVVADSGGRMLDDLVGANGSGNIELALRNGPYSDLVTKITDGFGNDEQLIWTTLANGSFVKGTFTPQDGFELTRRGRHVLASYDANDGVGGTYTMSYKYDTPERYLSAAPSFVGFDTITATDSRDGNATTATWAINPYQSGLLKETKVVHGNATLRDDIYDYGGVFHQLAKPDQVRNWETDSYDASGALLYTVRRAYTYDHEGDAPTYNLTGTTVTTTSAIDGDIWTAATTLTLDNSLTTADWCNALPSEVDVTNTLPDGDSEQRTTTYDPNTTYCREDSVTTNAQQTKTSTTTTWSYDNNFGNLTQVKVVGHNADGSAMVARITHFGYDSGHEFVTSVTDPAGDVTGVGWDGPLGVQSSRTAPNGSVTTYDPDGFGRLTKITLPGGGYQIFTYGTCGQGNCAIYGVPDGAHLTHMQRYADSGAAAGAAWRYYDDYGREVAQGVGRSGGAVAYQVKVYNPLGQIARTSVPHFLDDPAYWSDYTYDDPLHRLTQASAPAADDQQRVTDYAYPDGFKTQVTEESNGAVTTTTRDPLGEVTNVQDADDNATTYTYGAFGELTQVSGPDGVVSSIAYDTAGHRTQLDAPDTGVVNFTVDSLGEILSRHNPASGTLNYQYDALGRLTEEDSGNPSYSYTWHYAISGNAAGQLYKEESGSGSFSRLFTYDAYGELTQDLETWQGEGWWFNYGYDTLGRMTTMSYPNTAAAQRLKLAYGYDGNGQLASVSDANDGTVYWQQNAGAGVALQNAWGETQAWTLGSGTDVERIGDGATGAVSQIQAGPNGTATLVNLSYAYDPLGNVSDASDHVEGVSQGLSYDPLNRLTQVMVYNPNVPGGMSRGMGYAKGGNFTYRTLVGSYTYGENGAGPHAVTTIGHQGEISHYHYDAAGRMTSSGAFSAIDWNWAGEPRELDGDPSLWLNYTPDGDLLTKTVFGQAQWRYFGKLFVQTGNSYRERIVANGEVVAMVNVTGAGFTDVNYRIADNLGSTAVILSASGELEGRYAFDAWGVSVNPATGAGSDPNEEADEALTSLGYTGHEMFWEQGLVHTKMRLYDPGNGRWLSSDPIVPNLANGQSLNRYSYVLNNPLTYTDPYGYSIWSNLGNNWRQATLGAIQLAGGVLGTAGGVAIVVVGGGLGAAITLSGAPELGIPLAAVSIAFGSGVTLGSFDTAVAGIGNLHNASTETDGTYTGEGVGERIGLSPALAKGTQYLSFAHDLYESFGGALLMHGTEQWLGSVQVVYGSSTAIPLNGKVTVGGRTITGAIGVGDIPPSPAGTWTPLPNGGGIYCKTPTSCVYVPPGKKKSE